MTYILILFSVLYFIFLFIITTKYIEIKNVIYMFDTEESLQKRAVIKITYWLTWSFLVIGIVLYVWILSITKAGKEQRLTLKERINTIDIKKGYNEPRYSLRENSVLSREELDGLRKSHTVSGNWWRNAKYSEYVNWDTPYRVDKSRVIRVVDGDTLDLANGKRVRFLGINAPETAKRGKPAQAGANAAWNYAKSSLMGKEVVVIYPEDNLKGVFGRWLGFIFIDNMLFNVDMVKRRHAVVYYKYLNKSRIYNQKLWRTL